MNPNLRQLALLAEKPRRTILSTMSGTSLDGLDIGLFSIEGNGTDTKATPLSCQTIPYSEPQKQIFRQVLSQKTVELETLTLLNAWTGRLHADILNRFIQSQGLRASDIDLVASHGQTIYHAPVSKHGRNEFGNATLQIGDGDQVAVGTGIITVSDFRQKHVAAGGEGAPLAPYLDALMFSGKDENRILVNIGGIANLTYLPMDTASPIVWTDTGPGNTWMDSYVRQHFPGKDYDTDGAIASGGQVDDELLGRLMSDPFFALPLPKTTGTEYFHPQQLNEILIHDRFAKLPHAHIVATLNRLTAVAVADTVIKYLPITGPVSMYLSGGGIWNKALVNNLWQLLSPMLIKSAAEIGADPDFKETLLFAVLANEAVAGDPLLWKRFRPLLPIGMGKISFPG